MSHTPDKGELCYLFVLLYHPYLLLVTSFFKLQQCSQRWPSWPPRPLRAPSHPAETRIRLNAASSTIYEGRSASAHRFFRLHTTYKPAWVMAGWHDGIRGPSVSKEHTNSIRDASTMPCAANEKGISGQSCTIGSQHTDCTWRYSRWGTRRYLVSEG